jgi:hypothetical protein
VYTSYYLETDKRFNPQVTNCKRAFAMAETTISTLKQTSCLKALNSIQQIFALPKK